MRLRPARALLIVLVVLGLVMPQVSGAAAAFLPGAQVVVVCTGDGLRTLYIDESGKPVPVSDQHPSHCVLAHAADTAVRAEPAPRQAPPVDAVARRSGDLIRAGGYRAARPPPRAPPAA